MVQKLIRAVDTDECKGCLSINNSQMWQKVRDDPDYWPSWKEIKGAHLWKEERYKTSILEWLCGPGKTWVVQSVDEAATPAGKVQGVAVTRGTKRERMNYGPLNTVINAQSRTDVLVVEVLDPSRPMADVVEAAIVKLANQARGVRLLFWGAGEAIDALERDWLKKHTEGGAMLTGYKLKAVRVFLTSDSEKKWKQMGFLSCYRKAMLVTPAATKPCHPHAVSLIGWNPCLIAHLVGLFDLCTGPLASTPPSASWRMNLGVNFTFVVDIVSSTIFA